MTKWRFFRYSWLACSLVGCLAVCSGDAHAATTMRLAITGESNLRTQFIESIRDAGRESGRTIEVVPKSETARDYTIIIAQESSLGGAAAAVIALDRDGDVAASVVRSGRLSGRGAMNACAKELMKKLSVLAAK